MDVGFVDETLRKLVCGRARAFNAVRCNHVRFLLVENLYELPFSYLRPAIIDIVR